MNIPRMQGSGYKFLVDRMLGRLTAWLRILGYDTKSALNLASTPGEDTLLIAIADREGRILVSRDRVLIDRARKAGVEALLIVPDGVRDQLEVLSRVYHLDIDPVMTRCTACNSLLRAATATDMERIRHIKEVPGHILDEGKALWVCDNCGKVYWQGSHWRNILQTAREVKLNTRQHSYDYTTD